MKRLHAHVGSRDPALQQRPEVLKAVGVYATIHVLNGVIYHLMNVVSRQTFVGHEGIGIERGSSFDMFPYFILQYFPLTIRDDGSANLSATFQDAHDGSLVLTASSSDAALAFAG